MDSGLGNCSLEEVRILISVNWEVRQAIKSALGIVKIRISDTPNGEERKVLHLVYEQIEAIVEEIERREPPLRSREMDLKKLE